MDRSTFKDLLIMALRDNDTKRVSKLLEAGADPGMWRRFKVEDHETIGPIYILAQTTEMAEILLPYCDDRLAFLHWICARRSFDFSKNLFDTLFRSTLTKDEATSALFGILENEKAWKKNNKKGFTFLSELIDSGADLNAVDKFGDAALNHMINLSAIVQPNIKIGGISENLCISIIDFLLKKGADINNPKANSALCCAIRRHAEAISLFLLEKGAPYNKMFIKDGLTPLMYAVSFNKQMVQILLDKGVDVNETDNKGRNALFYLFVDDANKQTPEILNLLISKGICLDKKDNNGDSILSTLVDMQQFESLNLLLTTLIDLDNPDSDILERTILIRLLEVLYKDNSLYYKDPIFRDDIYKAIRKIVKAGADVSKGDCFGQTPLMLAAKHTESKKFMKVVNLLLENGADLNKQDVYGKTAYDYARDNSFLKKNNYTEIFFHG